LGGCGFHGSEATQGYCSVCAKKKAVSSKPATAPSTQSVKLTVKFYDEEGPREVGTVEVETGTPHSQLQVMVRCLTGLEPKVMKLMVAGATLDSREHFKPNSSSTLWVYNESIPMSHMSAGGVDGKEHFLAEEVSQIRVGDRGLVLFPQRTELKPLEHPCYWCLQKGAAATCQFCGGKQQLTLLQRVPIVQTVTVAPNSRLQVYLELKAPIHPQVYAPNLKDLVATAIHVSLEKVGNKFPVQWELVKESSDEAYDTSKEIGTICVSFEVKEEGIYVYTLGGRVRRGDGSMQGNIMLTGNTDCPIRVKFA